MDGVLVRGSVPIPGAQDFIGRLIDSGAKFAVLTNNPMHTPRDLQHRLKLSGLDIPDGHIFTSAMATAHFLNSQMPKGTAYAIGETGLTTALHDVGYLLTDSDPDYVVLGETTNYSFEQISKAVRLVMAGSRFIATNPDTTGPSDKGLEPACGAMAALIEKASGIAPYFVGKPNPFMMRSALRFMEAHSEEAVMVGDRMDTDIVAGMESGLDTILVLTGVTRRDDISKFPYRPKRVVGSVADIEVEYIEAQ